MKYDLIIIGGGPSGIMSAIRASEDGARVLLVEKNESLGLKLLITGHGRCNLTNMDADDRAGLNRYGPNHKFLFSAFNNFSVNDTLEFFKKIGIETKVETKGRVFPRSDKARDLLDALIKKLKENKVEIMCDASLTKIIEKDKKIEKVIINNSIEIEGEAYVIATGGKSYPLTGSTGDAYVWLNNLGHNIISPRSALAPLIVREKFIKNLEGISLKDQSFSIYENNNKIIGSSGDIIFTYDGVSGPAIIDISSRIGAIIDLNPSINFDFFPKLSIGALNKKLQDDFHKHSKKQLKNYLASILPSRLITLIINLCKVSEEKNVNSISKEERIELASILKNLSFKIEALKDFDKAMLTAGGVDAREVDPKTMKSKIVKNLFIVGELLDLDGPSGGYNLQICWSTGQRLTINP